MTRRLLLIGLLLPVACADPGAGPTLDAGPPTPVEEDTLAPDADSSGPASGPPGGTELAYAATRGVSTPWLVPVGPEGPGPVIRLGPRRGAGYGMGEGEVSYPEITPDGSTVVVVFYPLATLSSSGTGGATLFALGADGQSADSPVKVADAAQLHALERAYRVGWMAYVNGNQLFAARLDGSDAEAPLHVVTAPSGYEIDGLRWVGESGRLAWVQRPTSSGSGRRAYVADVTAEGAGAATLLQTAVGPAQWVAGVLADGRMVVAGPDDRLHAVDGLGGAPPVVLTPPDKIAGFVGATQDGLRMVAELRVTWLDTRDLVSVATDGSEALAPRMLTPTPARGLEPTMARDGTAVAWTAKNAAGQSAAFVAPAAGHAPGADPRVTPWGSQALHVTDFMAAAGPLVGSHDGGAVLRYATTGPPVEPTVLALVPDVVNHGTPWPVLSADGEHVLYDASTPLGFRGWVVPIDGGDAVEVKSPWYRDLLSAKGILFHEPVTEGAVFAADLEGHVRALSGWHASEVLSPHLVDEGRYVAFACESPEPGLYAASTAPASTAPGDAPKAALVMRNGAAPDPWTDGWSERPLVAAGHYLRRVDARILSYPLDGSGGGEGITVAADTAGPFTADPARGRVVFARGSGVWSAPVDGDGEETLVLTTGGAVSHIAVLPGLDRVLVAFQAGIVQAPLDGSGKDAPVKVAADLPGWLMGLRATETGGHVLTVHSIEATAVPHPDLMLAAATGLANGGQTGAPYALAPPGFLPWQVGPYSDGLSGGALPGPVSSPDGQHALLVGPGGLHTALIDGSEAGSPRRLGSATMALSTRPGPGGERLLLQEEGAVVISVIGEAGSQRTVVKADPRPLGSAFWASDGQQIVFTRIEPSSWKGQGALFVVDAAADAAEGTPLLPEGFLMSRLVSLAPAAPYAVVESTHGADHSLYLVSLNPANAAAPPSAITPVDDVGESFLGFLPAD